MALEHDDWAPPDEVDEYRLMRQIGRGTMGQVYLARDRLLDRLVAIKFITAIEPEARERFVIEARAAARIQHPNVVAVHRVGELHNRPYLITEYVRGQNLAELALPIPWARALELGVSLARGLAAAHGHGILHRDIKLANVVLSEAGEIKLLDFSLAKFVDVAHTRLRAPPPAPTPAAVREAPLVGSGPVNRLADTITISSPAPAPRVGPEPALLWSSGQGEITDVGALIGTPHYMAPELWVGDPASRASDVYALGVLLYCLCCGIPPTDATDILELASRVGSQDPPPLRERAPEVDRRFADIIDRCLRRDPAARFGSGEELRDALEGLTAALSNNAMLTRGNPYRGLQVFEAGQRDLFFGRANEIAAVVGQLRAQNFVIVAGDSGVGKSSLCRAGVLPTACEGGLDPALAWSPVILTPGRRPVHTIVAALARARELDEAALERASATPEEFSAALAGSQAAHGTLLFIDQLEELVTLPSPQDGLTAAQMLGAIARGVPRVRLLATVRGDFLTRIAPLPGIGEEMLRGLYFLYPLSPAGVRQAIVGPVQARGVRFESEAMVNQLVTAGIEGSLPLLQFALSELWEARASDSTIITVAALDKIGGVSGALARHAEGVLARLTPMQRRAARSLLLRLITIEETRASLNHDELAVEDSGAERIVPKGTRRGIRNDHSYARVAGILNDQEFNDSVQRATADTQERLLGYDNEADRAMWVAVRDAPVISRPFGGLELAETERGGGLHDDRPRPAKGPGKNVEIDLNARRTPPSAEARAIARRVVTIELEHPNIVGDMNRQTVREDLRAQTEGLRRCFRETVDKTERVGHVMLMLKVAGSGKVTSAQLKFSSTQLGPIGPCIIRVASAWKFKDGTLDRKPASIVVEVVYSARDM